MGFFKGVFTILDLLVNILQLQKKHKEQQGILQREAVIEKIAVDAVSETEELAHAKAKVENVSMTSKEKEDNAVVKVLAKAGDVGIDLVTEYADDIARAAVRTVLGKLRIDIF